VSIYVRVNPKFEKSQETFRLVVQFLADRKTDLHSDTNSHFSLIDLGTRLTISRNIQCFGRDSNLSESCFYKITWPADWAGDAAFLEHNLQNGTQVLRRIVPWERPLYSEIWKFIGFRVIHCFWNLIGFDYSSFRMRCVVLKRKFLTTFPNSTVPSILR